MSAELASSVADEIVSSQPMEIFVKHQAQMSANIADEELGSVHLLSSLLNAFAHCPFTILPMILAEITSGVGATATQSGFGSILAVTVAWTRSRSILICILAGILSWIYVIYFALTRRPSECARN